MKYTVKIKWKFIAQLISCGFYPSKSWHQTLAIYESRVKVKVQYARLQLAKCSKQVVSNYLKILNDSNGTSGLWSTQQTLSKSSAFYINHSQTSQSLLCSTIDQDTW